MENLIQQIEAWAGELPYWEQATLDKILSGKPFTEDDYQEILQYLLEDEDLADRQGPRKMLRFRKGFLGDQDRPRQIVLQQLSNLNNVNALVPDQRLTFSSQITAIYGQNGSGKSGYARVLGSAGFTRGDKVVLPDVSRPVDESMNGSAEITLMDNDALKTITFRVGKPCPEMASFYVFDSTSVKIHMSGRNTFSFSPSGLSVLSDLSDETDSVRTLLSKKVAEMEQPSELEKNFPGDSTIRIFIENLDADTNLEQIRELAKWSAADQRRLDEVKLEIGSIGLEKYREEIDRKTSNLAKEKKFVAWLRQAYDLLGDRITSEIDQAVNQFNYARERAEELSAESFQQTEFTKVGSAFWLDFVRTAKQLADEERGEGLYPNDADVCLLCHQPLSQDARDLILRLWAFLAGEARKEMTNSEQELSEWKWRLSPGGGFDIEYDHGEAVSLFSSRAPDLSESVEDIARSLSSRWNAVTKSLDSESALPTLAPLPQVDFQRLDQMIEVQDASIEELRSEDPAIRREILEQEERELEHRKQLRRILKNVEDYVAKRIWARDASKIGGNTRHITVKHNQLFDLLVLNRYVDLFERTLATLGRPMQVKISTSGQKGKKMKQITIRAHQSAKIFADPDKVLSEGEKRAVALADFLTEVKLDTTSRGIVLDDPVTSLDLEWRKTIAEILSEEARSRQVIVFTHDLPFLYLLLECASESELEHSVHWIKRGNEDGKPGYVYLDNGPAMEQVYKTAAIAERFYISVQKAAGVEEQQRFIKEGMGALRTSYEALVVFELFGGVVLRFTERISMGRLVELVWDQAICDEIDRSYARLSRYIEGHLHSDEFAAALTPQNLNTEIQAFNNLRKKIKDMKKSKGK